MAEETVAIDYGRVVDGAELVLDNCRPMKASKMLLLSGWNQRYWRIPLLTLAALPVLRHLAGQYSDRTRSLVG